MTEQPGASEEIEEQVTMDVRDVLVVQKWLREAEQRGVRKGLERAAQTAELFHHISADGVDWEEGDEQMRRAIYSNSTVMYAAAAIRALIEAPDVADAAKD